MTVELKLCGFRKLQDLKFAFENGANFIGVNNIFSSKRYLAQEEILSLVEQLEEKLCERVVVLLNEFDLSFLEKLKDLKISYVQSYMRTEDDEKLFDMGFKVIKVFKISSKDDLAELDKLDLAKYSYLLFDHKSSSMLGGSGESFDWALVDFDKLENKLGISLILAGGLKASNLKEAIASTKTKFVDMASAIEDENGEKSYEKILEINNLLKTF